MSWQGKFIKWSVVAAVLIVLFVVAYKTNDAYVHRTIETWQGKVTYISYNNQGTIISMSGRLLAFTGVHDFIVDHCYQVWFDDWGTSGAGNYWRNLDRAEEMKC